MALLAQWFDYHYYKLASTSFSIGKHRFSQVPVLTIFLYVLILVALILVYIPPIGIKVNGSWRWLNLVFFRFQPSEFAKIVMIVSMSVWLDRIGSKAHTFIRGTCLSFAILAPFAVLIVFQTDLGATMVVSILAVVLMVVAGVNLKHLIPLIGGGIATLACYLFVSGGYHSQKVVAWLHSCGWYRVLFGLEGVPDMERGDHLRASLFAIQSGGLGGVGYTHSLQKYRYLPESHTDFVFPIGAEEWGLKFSLIVVILFVTVLICGMIISCNAPDKLGRYLALGLTFMIVFQGMFNLMVVTGLAPTKGIALPFFSYGGTSIFSIMVAVGMLVNVAKHMETRSEEVHTLSERDVIHDI
jgi:cell division protein FtsW